MTDAERERLILDNQGLAYSLGRRLHATNRIVRRIGDESDVVQEALIALMRAARHYDPGRGIRFSTYAGRSIYHNLRAQGMLLGIIRVPVYHTREEEHHHQQQAEAALNCMSLDGDVPAPVRREGLTDRLPELVDRLPGRYRDVIRRYYGLSCPPESQTDISHSYGVRRATVSVWHRRALELLAGYIAEDR